MLSGDYPKNSWLPACCFCNWYYSNWYQGK